MKASKGEIKHLRFFGIPKLVPYIKPYRRNLVMIVIFGALASLLTVITPLFQKYALNEFVGGGSMKTVAWYVIIYFAIILLSGYVNYRSTIYAEYTMIGTEKLLRNRAFEHLQTLSFAYYNQNPVGSIHSRVMSDTHRIGVLISWNLFDFLLNSVYMIGALAIMLALNVKLALLVIAIVPFLFLFFFLFERKLVGANRVLREVNSRITSNFNEGITGAKTVKTLAVEKKILKKFTDDTADMRRKSVRASRIRGLFSAIMTLASSVALAVVLWKGGYIAKIEIGTFSAFMTYAVGICEPVRWFVDAISALISAQVNIERFDALINEKPDVLDSPEIIEKYGDSLNPKRENWTTIHGDIEFSDVTFRYPDGEENVLEHFSLSIPFGTHLAIVGETGAGKSTLANLVCRFFEATDGKILIDGKDVREYSQLWLHSSIGYVLQTPHLFSGTIRENILMGNPGATEEQIAHALKTVSADEVVAKFEGGLDTDVGEGGDLLSTGEKQLISFARAIITDPRILILDEATASVDTLTEQKIQNALERVIEGRTSIVIAHRLSTVRNADMILVVKNGKIIERGKHDELISAKGYYYELYTRQFEDESAKEIMDTQNLY